MSKTEPSLLGSPSRDLLSEAKKIPMEQKEQCSRIYL